MKELLLSRKKTENNPKNEEMDNGKEPDLVQEYSELEEKNESKSSSYEEQSTQHLYASKTHNKEGQQQQNLSQDKKVMVMNL